MTISESPGTTQALGGTSDMVTTEQLAEELGVSQQALANWRYEGTGPEFIKLGAKTVRYRRAAVSEWLVSRTFSRTNEVAEAAR